MHFEKGDQAQSSNISEFIYSESSCCSAPFVSQRVNGDQALLK